MAARATMMLLLIALLGTSDARGIDSPAQMAASVTIRRDQWGVPHIEGPTDLSVIFGYGYCQAEDYFWQVEENVLRALGRTAETYGAKGLDSDLLTRNFNVPGVSKADYGKLAQRDRDIFDACAAGMNHFLATHPDTKPRLINHFEGWMLSAHRKQVGLDWMLNKAKVDKKEQQKYSKLIELASNGWAIAPARTKDGSAMLFINPHQPWFGPGSWYEGHLKSGEGLNFTGASFWATPLPTLGHNEHLGWGHTANQPDVADAYRLTFDDSSNPLNYKTPLGYRAAKERTEVIRVREGKNLVERKFVFRDTEFGPVVKKEDDTHFIAVRIARMEEPVGFSQTLDMVKATNFDQWRTALSRLQLTMFNCIYADRSGNIAYIYNGAIPRRDPALVWTQPVDAADPRAAWKGYHTLAELPQVVNPASGYVQNCNQSPYFTTDDENPVDLDFPEYMVDEKNVDTRRAMVSRMLLRKMRGVTLDDWCQAGFDTTMHWPLTVLPEYQRGLEDLRRRNPTLAAKVTPYFEHLFQWDCRGSLASTQATLCYSWYVELYEPKQFGRLKPKYMDSVDARYEAIIPAANRLKLFFGDWKVPWGDACRMQRLAEVAVEADLNFSMKKPSLPSPGIPGSLGAVFNTTYLPPLPPVRSQQFGLAGHSYVACIEFGKNAVVGRSILVFGESGDPASPHFFDQAQLYSKGKLKNAWFSDREVSANAKRTYHPGEK